MGDSGVHPGVLKPHTEALVQGNLARVLRERFTGEQALLEAVNDCLKELRGLNQAVCGDEKIKRVGCQNDNPNSLLNQVDAHLLRLLR